MIKPMEAKKTLEELLIKSDFEKQIPNRDIILGVFKEFSKIEVDCSHDNFLFQCGVFNFTGEDLFYWDIVRQFMIDKDHDYDHIEQLHFEIKFEPYKELEDFMIIEWSSDDKDKYFDKIGNLTEFRLPLEKYKPKSVNIYQEQV